MTKPTQLQSQGMLKIVEKVIENSGLAIQKIDRFGKKELGKGAFGTVYTNGPHKVVKIVDSKMMDWEDYRDTCIQEIMPVILGVPKHPNLLFLYGLVEPERYEKECAIVTERIYKADVKRYSVTDFIKIVHGMFSGVQALHAAGILHRDIKPDNMIYGTRTPKSKNEDDRVLVVVDYGLSCIFDQEKEKLTSCANAPYAGTPYYQPKRCELAYSYDADVYACGRSILKYYEQTVSITKDEQRLLDVINNIVGKNIILKYDPPLKGPKETLEDIVHDINGLKNKPTIQNNKHLIDIIDGILYQIETWYKPIMIDYEDDVKRVKSTLKDIVGDIDTTTRDVKFLKADLNRIINKTRKVCPTPMTQQESVDFLGKLIEGVERIIQHENIYINRVIPYL